MRRFLLIDADDTLWENNIYFERAFEEFCDFLDHSTLTNGQVRAALDEIELVNNRIHGYGSANFARNLVECYHRLAERQIAEADIERILALAEQIARQPIELLDGVVETLDYLHGRHNLTLFTKGHPEEERLKLMFRVKAQIAPELLRKYIQRVKTGLPGMAYVRLDANAEWPKTLTGTLLQ